MFAEADEQLGEQEKKFIGFLLIATVEEGDESLSSCFLQHFPASLFEFKFQQIRVHFRHLPFVVGKQLSKGIAPIGNCRDH